MFCFCLQLFQKLEDTVLSKDEQNGDSVPSVRGDGDSNTKVPARIREIITKNLSADDLPRLEESGLSPTVMSLQEENRMLTNELSRVEDLLSASRAERDEIAIKYQALSDRVRLRCHLAILCNMNSQRSRACRKEVENTQLSE